MLNIVRTEKFFNGGNIEKNYGLLKKARPFTYEYDLLYISILKITFINL